MNKVTIEGNKITIDGVEYVPAAEVPNITIGAYNRALRELTAIQYFNEEKHKHRAWAWDALEALAPELIKMNPQDAYHEVRMEGN